MLGAGLLDPDRIAYARLVSEACSLPGVVRFGDDLGKLAAALMGMRLQDLFTGLNRTPGCQPGNRTQIRVANFSGRSRMVLGLKSVVRVV